MPASPLFLNVPQPPQPGTTGAGWYGFYNLAPGCYVVKFTPPANFVFSPQDQGSDDTVDSDASLAGTTGQFTLSSGQYNPTIDAGVYPQTSALGDRVWQDLNADGIQDANEPGICGVPVKLLNRRGRS